MVRAAATKPSHVGRVRPSAMPTASRTTAATTKLAAAIANVQTAVTSAPATGPTKKTWATTQTPMPMAASVARMRIIAEIVL